MKKSLLKIVLSICFIGVMTGLIEDGRAQDLTAAGIQIRNQSVATYTDYLGREQTSTSNEVITEVSPVYALEILPDVPGTQEPGNFTGTPALEQAAAAGNTVYYGYTLQNLGNVPDTFDLKYYTNEVAPAGVRIYQDVNGDGQVDPGDRLLNDDAGAGVWGASETFSVEAGTTIHILVAVEVPVSAGAGDLIEVDIDARSTGDTAETDAVSNFSRTTVTDRGVLTADKAVSPTSARGGDTLTYSLTGSNTGNAPVYGRDFQDDWETVEIGGVDRRYGLLIQDELQVGKYDLTSLNYISHGPSVAQVVYLKGSENTWQENKPADLTDLAGIGLFIETVDAGGEIALADGQSYSLQFEIDLDEDLSEGTVENSFEALYHDGSDPQETESNTTLVSIAGPGSTVPGVAFGPDNYPEFDGHPDHEDGQQEDKSKASPYTELDGNIAEAGEVITFTNAIRNLGNMTDTINITVEANTVAGGEAVVSLLKSDGVTPLSDTSGNGIPDTGPLDPDADYSLVVEVRLPADAEDETKSHIQLRAATSNQDIEGEPDWNDTFNVIGEIRPAGVDVGQTGSTGDGNPDNDTPPAQDIAPGGFVDFPLDVQNIRGDGTETGAVDTYNLIVTELPADWSAVIYRDADGSGTLDPGELTPITNTVDLNPGAIDQVIVRITASEDAVEENINTLEFIATSTNNPDVNDSVVLEMNVESISGVSISPDNSAVAVRGGTYIYRHVVTNNANAGEDMALTAAFAGDSAWSYTFVDENGVNLGEENTLSALTPGASEEVFVKIFVPGNASVGSTEILVVTVTGVESGATDDAVDATTVVDGNLQLTKTADESEVRPTPADASGSEEFHPITYTTEFQNLGSATVEDVVILDAIPANSRVVVADDGGDGVTAPTADTLNSIAVDYSADGGTNWGYNPDAAGDHTNSSVTHVRWEIGTVEAGAGGEVTFQVLVD